MVTAFVLGLVVGFVGSIPIAGPTAVVVVNSALDNRPRSGFEVAIGSAVAEAIYAAAAFWGVAALIGRYPVVIPASRIFGAAVLILVGIYFIRRKSQAHPRSSERIENRRGRHLLFGFTITIFNPTLAATWAAIVAALHAAFNVTKSSLSAIPFGLGAFLGIVGWTWILIRLMCRFRKRVRPSTLNGLVRAAGGALVIVGAVLASRAIIPPH